MLHEISSAAPFIPVWARSPPQQRGLLPVANAVIVPSIRLFLPSDVAKGFVVTLGFA